MSEIFTVDYLLWALIFTIILLIVTGVFYYKLLGKNKELERLIKLEVGELEKMLVKKRELFRDCLIKKIPLILSENFLVDFGIFVGKISFSLEEREGFKKLLLKAGVNDKMERLEKGNLFVVWTIVEEIRWQIDDLRKKGSNLDHDFFQIMSSVRGDLSSISEYLEKFEKISFRENEQTQVVEEFDFDDATWTKKGG